ncbi:MAG: methyltransferase [Pseudomonadota bacterium]
MMKNVANIVIVLAMAVGTANVYAQPAAPYKTDAGKKVHEAMSGDIRTDAEKARDANRKPIETLEFFGLKEDMRVMEMFPGGGWYTKLLAPALADKGKLYLALGGRLKDRLSEWGFDKVELLDTGSTFKVVSEPGTFIADLGKFDLSVKDLDMVLTFRNLHNIAPESRAMINKTIFKALKPGGIYGVIDHTKRHMEGYSKETWRRLDPVLVIKESLDAGFEFVGYSDLHYRADDELLYDMARRAVKGNSDRFTLKFRKPE